MLITRFTRSLGDSWLTSTRPMAYIWAGNSNWYGASKHWILYNTINDTSCGEAIGLTGPRWQMKLWYVASSLK